MSRPDYLLALLMKPFVEGLPGFSFPPPGPPSYPAWYVYRGGTFTHRLRPASLVALVCQNWACS